MTHDKYYLISPTDALRALITEANADVREYLSSPLLWTGQFPDRGPLTTDDEVMLVQSLFLLGILEMIAVADLFKMLAENQSNFQQNFSKSIGKYLNYIKMVASKKQCAMPLKMPIFQNFFPRPTTE